MMSAKGAEEKVLALLRKHLVHSAAGKPRVPSGAMARSDCSRGCRAPPPPAGAL